MLAREPDSWDTVGNKDEQILYPVPWVGHVTTVTNKYRCSEYYEVWGAVKGNIGTL